MRYLDGLKRSDAMLQILIGELEQRGRPAVVAFYGDHLPSLPHAFAHFGFTETSSDYVIWNGGATAERRDLPAHQLGQAAIAALAAPPTGAHEAESVRGRARFLIRSRRRALGRDLTGTLVSSSMMAGGVTFNCAISLP